MYASLVLLFITLVVNVIGSLVLWRILARNERIGIRKNGQRWTWSKIASKVRSISSAGGVAPVAGQF